MSNATKAAAPPPGDSADDGNPPDVDTTLLESLFYNEMMMLDDSSDLLSSVTGAVGDPNANIPPPPIFRQGPAKVAAKASAEASAPSAAPATKGQPAEDPLTCAEQSLLRDFGVTDAPFPHLGEGTSSTSTPSSPHPQQQQRPQKAAPEAKANPPTQPPPPSQGHDPSRYPPQHYYQNHPYYHPQAGHSYPPPSAGHPPPHHSYQSAAHQQAPIQPRPPAQSRRVSKGIKHSVTSKQSPSSPSNPKPLATSPVAVASIPNPLANQHHSQPPPSHPHAHHPPTAYHPHPHHQAHPHHQGQHAYHYRPPPTGAPAPALVPVPAPAPVHPHPQQYAYAAPPPTHGHGAPPAPHYGSAAAAQPHISPTAPGHLAPAPHPHSHPPPHMPSPHTPAPPPPGPHSHPHPHPHHHAYAHPHQPPKEQLVSQFATLANRLGINLPSEMLSSLTESAGMVSGGGQGQHNATNNGLHNPAAGPPVPFPNHSGQPPYAPRPNSSKQPPSGEKSRSSAEPAEGLSDSSTKPVAEALRKTAEEAIAAVTRKRPHDDSTVPNTAASANAQSEENNAKPSYAKRRKKPRLADCESRLERLRAENETLKRHLDNVTNKTEMFEQGRIKAEKTMKEMMENKDTPDDELNTVIREYSEAYSDYGRRRHEELSFHLEQLQKLANPTNFTKMGLWTIAKANDSKDISKQNPLVGTIAKELTITPPQIRKILEQRQKIRDLCNNLNATLGLILQLKELCEQKNKKFNDRMTKTRAILNPKQVVKLIMWIKDYSDVLGNIFPGWTSEQHPTARANAQKKKASDEKDSKGTFDLKEENPSEATPATTAPPAVAEKESVAEGTEAEANPVKSDN